MTKRTAMAGVVWLSIAALLAPVTPAARAQQTGMSMREAVEYALAHSPDLQSARIEIEKRQAAVQGARSFLLPQVDLYADAAQSRFEHGYPAGAPPSLLRFDSALYTGGAELKMLAWDFRKTRLELEAARERTLAARPAVDRKRQEIVFETARQYLQAAGYEDLIRASEARINSLAALLERTNKLIDGGRAVPSDAFKIKTRLAQMESDLAAMRAGRRTALGALAAVMGYEGELPEFQYSPPAPAPAPETPTGVEALLLEQALGSRPEIAAQDHEIRASQYLLQAARKALLPRADFRAAVIEYGSNTPAGFPQLIGKILPAVPSNVPSPGNAAADWVVGGRIVFPLFDGGRRKSQIETARTQAEQARLGRKQIELRVARELRAALADLDSAQGRVKALRTSVEESARVLHDERIKYEAGRSVIDFVLDAESSLLMSESLLAQARRSVSIARLAVDLSAGRIDAASVAAP